MGMVKSNVTVKQKLSEVEDVEQDVDGSDMDCCEAGDSEDQKRVFSPISKLQISEHNSSTIYCPPQPIKRIYNHLIDVAHIGVPLVAWLA
jgi:hypothetical protein